MRKLALAVAVLAGLASAGEPRLVVPSVSGALTVDGVPDEPVWERAAVLPLGTPEFSQPFPAPGEMRALVRDGYLCLSARLPESGRLVARSTGASPAWWPEDRVVWTINFRSFSTALRVTVNPLGAYSAEYARTPQEPAAPILAAASAAPDGWSVEVAIPLTNISALGFLSGERVRVARPDAPERHAYWPAANELLRFAIPDAKAPAAAPVLQRREWWSRQPSVRPEPASPLEAQLRALSPTVLPGSPDDAARIWQTNLRARVNTAALDERRAWEQVRARADWERFRDSRIAALKRSFGPFPERTPLHAEVTRRIDLGHGFVIENLIFEPRPGLLATANLYLPATVSGRIPAVVVVHSHHAPKTQWELQDMGMTWARSGVAVLVMELLGAGDRLQSQPWPRESYYSRDALGKQLYLAGESLMKWFVWDLMRGVDLLAERPYIDPARIVLLGAVAGGGDPAAVAGLLDSRIAAVIPFNFGEAGPEEHYTEGPRPYDPLTADPGWGSWESTRNLRRSIADQFFPWFLCAARAPNPFVYAFEIGWPNGVEREPAWARYRKVYELYGKLDHLANVDGYGPFPGPGEVTNVGADLRRKLYPILNRFLGIPIPTGEFHKPLPEADLLCLTPQAAARRKPRTAAALAEQLATERLAAARAKREALAPADRLRALREEFRDRLGEIDPGAPGPAQVAARRSYSGFSAENVVLETEPGIRLPLILLKPAGSASARLPVVLALASGGKAAFLRGRSAVLGTLLEKGVAICLADVRGTGETASSGADALAATGWMLGSTAMGQRLKDARAILRYLASREDLSPARIAVWGDSSADANPAGMLLDQSPRQQKGPQALAPSDPVGPALALLIALYEENVRAVAARGGLLSYQAVLRDRFCYVPSDAIVPGLLEVADLPDVAAAIAPKPVLLARMVDGRNRRVTLEESVREYEDALRASHGSGSASPSLQVIEEADDNALAAWLAEQIAPK